MKVIKGYEDYYSSPVLDEVDAEEPELGVTSRVVQVFVNADMRTWKKGMAQVCEANGIDVEALNNGQFVIFINGARTKMKFYCANKVIAYLNNGNERLTFEHLRAVPEALGSTADMVFAKALQEELYTILTSPVSAPAAINEEADLPSLIVKRKSKRVASK